MSIIFWGSWSVSETFLGSYGHFFFTKIEKIVVFMNSKYFKCFLGVFGPKMEKFEQCISREMNSTKKMFLKSNHCTLGGLHMSDIIWSSGSVSETFLDSYGHFFPHQLNK